VAINMTPTGTEARRKEIKAIAKKVYDLSFNYHLTHAVFGSDGLLFRNRKEAYKTELTELNKNLQTAKREENKALVASLEAQAQKLLKGIKKRKYHILVDYVAMDDINGGRVINLDDNLHIQLSNKLTSHIYDDATIETQEANVEKVRKIMAHELGHIVLHADQLPPDAIEGSHNKKIENVDWEAKVFATELLHLYHKNKR